MFSTTTNLWINRAFGLKAPAPVKIGTVVSAKNVC